MSIDDGLRPLLQRQLRQVDWQSIESGLTGQGIPDLSGCYRGVDFWVECKATHAWAVAVRTEQISWAERRIRHGGRVYLAVRRRHDGGPQKGAAVDELWIYWGGDTRHVARVGIGGVGREFSPLLVERGGESGWNWGLVLEVLSRDRAPPAPSSSQRGV